MTNKKSTKKALISSALCLLLCLSMLVGTTFAWFTDSVGTTNNIITAGNLDVNLYYKTTSMSDWAAVKADTNVFSGNLWEPGHTEVVYLKVVNEGSLALKYSLDVNVDSEIAGTNVANKSFKLSDFIRYNVYSGVKTYANSAEARGDESGDMLNIPYNKAAQLLNEGESVEMTLVVFMPTTVGNEANYLKGTTAPTINLGINLFATQYVKESDSYGPNYDKYAGKTVVTPENAQEAIWAAKEGDIIYLDEGIYGDLVIENENGTPKKGITIEHIGASNGTSFAVSSINLNSSEDIVISGIYFDVKQGATVYKKDGTALSVEVAGVKSEVKAGIIGAKSGAATGAKNIVIHDCTFSGTGAAKYYVAICFEEQGRPTSRATNITITNCHVENSIFNFVRANYMAEGTVAIMNSTVYEETYHSAINLTGNAANIIVKDNVFGTSMMSDRYIMSNGWNPDKAMLGTSRQGSNLITIEVTGNKFIQKLNAEGHVIDLKSSYTEANTILIFEDNTYVGMTEANVPCIWHN